MKFRDSKAFRAGAGDPGGENPESVFARTAKVRAEFWPKFRRVAGRIPFAEDLVAAYYCALDTRTPLKVRAALLGALVYFILPVDAIPDVIAGLGYTDDAAVLAAVISMVAQNIHPRHRVAAARALDRELPEDLQTA